MKKFILELKERRKYERLKSMMYRVNLCLVKVPKEERYWAEAQFEEVLRIFQN